MELKGKISKAEYARLMDIKSRKLLGMHVSRDDAQWVLDLAARVREPIPSSVLNSAAAQGYATEHVTVA